MLRLSRGYFRFSLKVFPFHQKCFLKVLLHKYFPMPMIVYIKQWKILFYILFPSLLSDPESPAGVVPDLFWGICYTAGGYKTRSEAAQLCQLPIEMLERTIVIRELPKRSSAYRLKINSISPKPTWMMPPSFSRQRWPSGSTLQIMPWNTSPPGWRYKPGCCHLNSFEVYSSNRASYLAARSCVILLSK